MAREFDLQKAKKNVKIVLGISIAGAIFMMFLGILDAAGALELPLDGFDYFIFAGMAFTGPYGFYQSKIDKVVEEIERRLPDFLRDVSEAGRFGMTLADAIVVASSGRYGRLTPEIRKMAAQIQWGVPAAQAIDLFAERVNTPLVGRITTIVIKASDAGGNVADVLSMVAHSVKEVHHAQDEQRIEMTTYLAVIYIAYMVFIATIIILSTTFLPQMEKAGLALEEGGAQTEMGGGAVAMIQAEYIPEIKFIFALSVMIHAIGDGIVAGILQKGKISEGLKHSFIMLLIGFISLRVFFGGINLMG